LAVHLVPVLTLSTLLNWAVRSDHTLAVVLAEALTRRATNLLALVVDLTRAVIAHAVAALALAVSSVFLLISALASVLNQSSVAVASEIVGPEVFAVASPGILTVTSVARLAHWHILAHALKSVQSLGFLAGQVALRGSLALTRIRVETVTVEALGIVSLNSISRTSAAL
jgi:hypothetical protein